MVRIRFSRTPFLKPHKLQLKIVNQSFQFGVILRIDELGGFEEGFGMTG